MVDDLFTVADDGEITLAVQAQPGAGRGHVVGRHGDALRVRVAAPPEHGRANDALVKLLAEEFGVDSRDVELVAGEKSRRKRFRIRGVEADDFARRLEQLVEGGSAAPGPTGRDRRRTPPGS
jgi:uncharacterized protein (TIGR00251 family)